MVMRKALTVTMIGVVGLLVLAAPVAAQTPGDRPSDRAGELRQQVMHRFMTQVRTNTGMDDEQFARFEQLTRDSFDARQQQRQREREIWQALEREMRPGVAADSSVVADLLDELIALGEAKVEQARREQAEYAAFLTPVQRAQVVMAWHWLETNIERIREERMNPDRPQRRRPGG
jgi:Spy/CpxP family protein refolding chaperone